MYFKLVKLNALIALEIIHKDAEEDIPKRFKETAWLKRVPLSRNVKGVIFYPTS